MNCLAKINTIGTYLHVKRSISEKSTIVILNDLGKLQLLFQRSISLCELLNIFINIALIFKTLYLINRKDF